jgi:repressor LexA
MVELKLTKRQQEIFDFIKRYSARNGYPPTVRDIGKAIGLTSSSTVHAHLANLEKQGVLRRDPTKPRAMEILDKAKRAVMPAGLPLVGRVAAGQPILADENIEDYVEVPQIAGGDDGEYVLKVQGDSRSSWRCSVRRPP